MRFNGEVLRTQRKAKGLSQEELATRAAVDGNTVSNLERGDTKSPRGDTVEKLAKALEIDPLAFYLPSPPKNMEETAPTQVVPSV